jgi:hypothetical protein
MRHNNRRGRTLHAQVARRFREAEEDWEGGRRAMSVRGSMAAPESHGVVKGHRDQQRDPSN